MLLRRLHDNVANVARRPERRKPPCERRRAVCERRKAVCERRRAVCDAQRSFCDGRKRGSHKLDFLREQAQGDRLRRRLRSPLLHGGHRACHATVDAESRALHGTMGRYTQLASARATSGPPKTSRVKRHTPVFIDASALAKMALPISLLKLKVVPDSL